jgi:para-nitrobenzyl esterase
MVLRRCIVASITLSLAVPALAAGPIELDPGRIPGIDEGDFRVYKGIPFAAPPVGTLRWRAATCRRQ